MSRPNGKLTIGTDFFPSTINNNIQDWRKITFKTVIINTFHLKSICSKDIPSIKGSFILFRLNNSIKIYYIAP